MPLTENQPSCCKGADAVGLPQLADLALKGLDPLALLRRRPSAQTLAAFDLPPPV